jgi:TIR domain
MDRGQSLVTGHLKPTGFWSYATSDDAASRRMLSRLRGLLAAELQLKFGRMPRVRIFQDVVGIPPGSDWLKEVFKALDESSFFIPIVTPAFLQSEMCCREVLHFRKREAALRRDDLMFPLYYVDIDNIDASRPSDCHDKTVLDLLHSRQWVDFRKLRLNNINSKGVRSQIENLAKSLHAALHRVGLEPDRTPITSHTIYSVICLNDGPCAPDVLERALDIYEAGFNYEILTNRKETESLR